MKDLLYNLVIGKNLPHAGRWLATFVGSLFLTGALFSPETTALDASLADAAIAVQAPSAAQVEDGLTVQETFGTIGGFLLIWGSRLVSFFRAKNLDWVARIFGVFIGRSIPSGLRALMVIAAGALARFTAQPELAPEVLAQMPLANVLTAIALVIFANLTSATEDAKRNPVKQFTSSDWGL